MRYSVPGYNIFDKLGQVLYNGDVVLKYWGGGHSARGPYRSYRYHTLYISPKGRLSVSGCSNHIDGRDLIKQSNWDHRSKRLFNIELKEYY